MIIPRTVFALTKCADTEASRYGLGGIRFTRPDEKHAMGEATDGRVLVRVRWEDDSPVELPENEGKQTHAIVSVADCKRVVALDKPTARELRQNPRAGAVALKESEVNGQVPLCTKNARIEPEAVEGRWPMTDNVFSDADNPTLSVKLDAKRLIPLLQTMVANCTDDEGVAPVTFTLQADAPPVKGLAVCPDCHKEFRSDTLADRFCPVCSAQGEQAYDHRSQTCAVLLTAEQDGKQVAGIMMPYVPHGRRDSQEHRKLEPAWNPTE